MKKIFISYCNKDTKYKDRLVTHLGVLQKQGLLKLWDDESIEPGDDWRAEIENALNNANVAITLISADYLNSDFIIFELIPRLLEQKAKNSLRIIPVIVKPCAWKKVEWLKEIQVISLADCSNDTETERQYSIITEKAYKALNPDKTEPKNQTQKAPEQWESINTDIPVFIEIRKQDKQYTGTIHQGTQETAFPLPVLPLDRKIKPFKDHAWTLEHLVEAIIKFNPNDLKAFDERVQLESGQYLYDQTLGRLPGSNQKQINNEKDIQLRILTKDEWIAGLPWNLLAYKGIFRCTTGWSVSVSRHLKNVVCDLPPCPRMLIIAPQPVKEPETRAKDHIEDLEDILSSYDQLMSRGNNLQVAHTWEDFTRLTKEFNPHLVYYYGHGTGDSKKTRLIFATGKKLKRTDKPISDFALCLRNMDKPPILAYINCCLGDAGGFLGAGMQLGDFIPAVITNRTVVQIPVAQAQAMALWKNILVQAIPPHKAVASLYARMDVRQLSTADIRWITPVLHAHYSQWNATPPSPPDRLTQDPHWHLKIDRISQFNSVIAQTRLMVREQKPKSLVFVWYGQKGQGIEIFHKRLLVELREDLTNTFVCQVRPAWPLHLGNYHTCFSKMLSTAFGVQSLEEIPARIRSESHGAFGKQTLVYIRHEPVRASRLINPETLKTYVQWWDAEFAPLLEKKQFALLSISFIVKNPPVFAEYVQDEKIDELDLKQTVFWFLDEMEKVAKRDLLLFLRTHNIDLPLDRRDKVLQKILEKTGGRYEQTVEELKKLRKEAWSVVKKKDTKSKKTRKKEYDY